MEIFASTNFLHLYPYNKDYIIKTGAFILDLENLGNVKLSETEFAKIFIHKTNKPGTPCSNLDGKPAQFILLAGSQGSRHDLS